MPDSPTFTSPRRAAPERRPVPRLALAAGLFAVIIGLLLRSAVANQDDTGWNGTVRTFLDAFPLVLIIGGALVLIAVGISVLRQPRNPT